MTPRTSVLLAGLVVALFGCDRAGQRALRGADVDGAAADAERRAAVAAHELEHPRARGEAHVFPDDLRDAAEDVRREREDVAEAAERQRGQYRGMLAKEIAAVDKRVSELTQELARAAGAAKDGKARDISAARGWRARLKHDLDQLDRVGEEQWPEVRERIDHDLEDERPASVPKGLEKSLTI